MLTVALHYETGYLAFVPLLVWPFLVPSDLWRRLGRAVALGAAAALASAWVIVPVLAQSHWAARNQVLEGTGLENGYGARQMLWWLVTGNLYDNDRFPAGVHVYLSRRHRAGARRHRRLHCALAHLGRRPRPRDDLGGHAGDVVRAHDVRVLLRRSSPAAATSSSAASRWACSCRASCWPASRSSSWAASSCAARWPCSPRIAAAGPPGRPAGASSPGCASSRWSWCSSRPGATSTPTTATTRPTSACRPRPTRNRGPQIDRLLDYVRAHPMGRVYAGSPTNWGEDFVGGRGAGLQVPGEQGHRRGRLHAAHGLADDRPRVLLRREQPGRLPALRHRLPHPPLRHGVAGGGRQGRLLGGLLPLGAPPRRVHPRLRHHRRAHGHPGRRRLAERDPAASRRSSTSSATSPSPSTGRRRPRRPRPTRRDCRDRRGVS